MNIEERAAQAAANGHETLDTDSSAVAEEKGRPCLRALCSGQRQAAGGGACKSG